MIPHKRVSLACFEFPTKLSQKIERLGFDKGFRVDPESLQWVYLKDYVLQPYSYMTLLLREQVDWEDPDYIFDIEKYNFIIDQKTPFTIDDQISLRADHLDEVLKNYAELDSDLFDLL